MGLELVFISIAVLLGSAATISTLVALLRNRPRAESDTMPTAAQSALDMLAYLQDARRSVDAVGGELAPFSMGEVADTLVRKLSANEDFHVRIIGGPEIQPTAGGRHETYERWKQLYGQFGDRFQMRFSDGWPGQHFVIIDNEMLILDEPHQPFDWPRKLHIFRGTYFAIRRFARRFEELWLRSTTAGEPVVRPDSMSAGTAPDTNEPTAPPGQDPAAVPPP